MKLKLLICILAIQLQAKQSIVWATCVYNNKILPCKLVDDKIYINSKEIKHKKLDVIVFDGDLCLIIKGIE